MVKLFKRNEGNKCLFKGLTSTFLRDVPQFAIYFAVYDCTKYLYIQGHEYTPL